MSFKHLYREFIASPKFFLFFTMNLTLGLVGFIALDAFKESFKDSLESNSKAILTADMSVSSRRSLTESEQNSLDQYLAQHPHDKVNQLSIYSMVKHKNKTRLAQIRAIEEKHPFYGHIQLKNQGIITADSQKDIQSSPKAWVYPELMTQLGIKIHSKIKIGHKEFEVSDIVSDDAGASAAGAAMAPRIYIAYDQMQDTKLIQKGSTFWSSTLVRFIDQDLSIKPFVKGLNKILDDPGVRVRSHSDASEQSGRVLGYLNDYLGLVALTALFLSGLGAAFLYRSYLNQNLRNIAILLSLGATQNKAIKHNITMLAILGLTSGLLSIILSQIILPLIPILVKNFLPIDMEVYVSYRNVFIALSISIMGSLLISLPMLMKIKGLKPNALFQESTMPQVSFASKDFIYVVPAFISYWLLAVWQSKSLIVGSIFVAGFLVSAFVLGVVAFGLLKLVQKSSGNKSLSFNLAIKYLIRNKSNSLSCLLALGLGTLLINLIPQIKSSLESEIQAPRGSKLPSLFYFDIQEEQVKQFESLLSKESTSLNQLSPMIRARLMRINGKEFTKSDNESKVAKTREQDRANQQRNRTYNLSYRERLSDSETIIDGMPFSGNYNFEALPEISLEERFADRLNLKVGDTMEFEILGVPFEGKVVNLRKVRWTDFQPNFFILLQPGSLEGAPKTFIASSPAMTTEHKVNLQSKIVDKFPNISMIDVSRVISKLINTISKMEDVLKYMAWLSLLAGFVVLYSIANHQAKLKQKDVALLKVLGAKFQTVQRTTKWEFLTLSLISSSIGAGISIFFGWFISFFIFDGVWTLEWFLPAVSTLAVVLMTLIVSYIATQKSLKVKPSTFLNS